MSKQQRSPQQSPQRSPQQQQLTTKSTKKSTTKSAKTSTTKSAKTSTTQTQKKQSTTTHSQNSGDMTKKFKNMNLQPPKNTGKRKRDKNLLHGMSDEDIKHLAKKTKYNKNENKTTIIGGRENYGLDHVTPNNDNYTTGVVFGRKKNSNYGFQTNSDNYYGGN